MAFRVTAIIQIAKKKLTEAWPLYVAGNHTAGIEDAASISARIIA